MPEVDHRRVTIQSKDDVIRIRTRVIEGIHKTSRWLCSLEHQPLSLFEAMRFRQIGHDPLTLEPQNIIEQLNQTYTILASLRAVDLLFQLHPEIHGYRIAMATCSGRDIESFDAGTLAAEVFCATHPQSNRKLQKEIARMSNDPAKHRYVFFYSPAHSGGRVPVLETHDHVHVYAVTLGIE